MRTASISVKILRNERNCTIEVPVMTGNEYGLIAKMISHFVDHNRPEWLRSLEKGYTSHNQLQGL